MTIFGKNPQKTPGAAGHEKRRHCDMNYTIIYVIYVIHTGPNLF
jgi:hypothetical protein